MDRPVSHYFIVLLVLRGLMTISLPSIAVYLTIMVVVFVAYLYCVLYCVIRWIRPVIDRWLERRFFPESHDD